MSDSTEARAAQVSGLAQTLTRLDELTHWERRPRDSVRAGLDPMRELMARLGDPHQAFRSIHVAGTKGNGSVCALLEAALLRAGLRAGRYASPHVVDVTERFSLGGRPVAERNLSIALADALDAYEAARADGGAARDATWFDLLTAASFLLFQRFAVEWAVVEVGIGGRFDSTNVVSGEIAVVTNIGLEHTEILGKTREAIAADKIGILKPGARLVTTLGPDDAAGRVLHEAALRLGCPVHPARSSAEATIEEANVALAGLALDQFGELGGGTPIGAWLLDPATRDAARLPGRMERREIAHDGVRVPVVFDGAHVPFNLAAVLRDCARQPGLGTSCVAVVALAHDKDAIGFLTELARAARFVVFTQSPVASRSRATGELSAIAASLGLASEVEEDSARAFQRAVEFAARSGAWLLVTGSLYLVGALRGSANET
jgi:dihydrofolate synthase / folylpolyglutamate synthase